MSATDRILIQSGSVVDLDSDHGILINYDVLIENGLISQVGQSIEAAGAEIIDATGFIVSPGFVDTHRHMWQGQLRGSGVNATLGEYFGTTIAEVAPRYRPSDVETGELMSGLDCLDAGITSVFDWSHIQHSPDHSDAAVRGLHQSGVRAVFGYGFPLTDVGAWMVSSSIPVPADLRRVHGDHFATGTSLVTLGLALRGPEYTTWNVVEEDLGHARDLGLPVSLHFGGGDGPGRHGIARMHERGLLGSDLAFVHGNSISEPEFELLAATGGSISATPAVEAQMGMGNGVPAIAAARRFGVQVGLGADVPTSASTSMFDIMRVAFATTRAAEFAAGTTDLVTNRDVLRMATLAGARAIGLGDMVGSIEVGKRADIILVSTESLAQAPSVDSAASLVSTASRSDVDTVIVDGVVRKRGGQLVDVDVPALLARARASASHVLGA